eukprot:TRINITY_DN5241_c0_g1_i3.p1 TRINITY_DN5241_c0_g1~~TRINITY_DN5241_c0_g1_i3.p1  ORF type:complete len:202 (-),score=37.17 TRINITY_DN5241_c0_g1_i3:462-983(-)
MEPNRKNSDIIPNKKTDSKTKNPLSARSTALPDLSLSKSSLIIVRERSLSRVSNSEESNTSPSPGEKEVEKIESGLPPEGFCLRDPPKPIPKPIPKPVTSRKASDERRKTSLPPRALHGSAAEGQIKSLPTSKSTGDLPLFDQIVIPSTYRERRNVPKTGTSEDLGSVCRSTM